MADDLPFLRGLPWLGAFDEQAPPPRLWRLERGATLFSEGDRADSAFVVVRGAIEVTRERGDRRVRLATVGPGRLFGELSLIDGGPRTATCVAAEPAVVLELDREAMLALLDDHSAAGLEFLQAVNRSLIAALHATDSRRTKIGADGSSRKNA